jgi:hypothetical protein
VPASAVIALVFAVLVLVALNVATVRLRTQMIGKLNAHNPPERQYDRWGWQIATKRWNLFSRPYYWWEYGRVFGFDRLLLATTIIMAASGALGLMLALFFARMALTGG